MKGGRKKRGLFSRVRRVAKKAGRVAKQAGKSIAKKVGKETFRRGVMAARRAADFGARQVPIAGNVYSLADFGLKTARAAKKGKLKQFLVKNAAEGIAEALAPQAMAAVSAQKAASGVTRAIVEGKGCGCGSGKAMKKPAILPGPKRPPRGPARVKRITERQENVLKRHSRHHSSKHMNKMRKDMMAGKTFTQAHQNAMRSVGK